MHLYIVPCLQQNLPKEIHPLRATPLLSVKLPDFFPPESIVVCAALPSRRVSRKSSAGLEEALMTGVANESSFVDFFLLLM